jgi:release factor glutamine methyltransferase
LASATIALSAAGCESPRLDAELLLAHALGCTRERLFTEPSVEVAGTAARAFREHVRRRSVEREPLAYILGRRHFRRLELRVDRRALIPRPETELLVEVGLTLPDGMWVHDVGTGSGAVALALAHERTDLRISASDVSDAALTLARENAQRLALSVDFEQGDLLDALPAGVEAVMANLPYVPDADRPKLSPEIVRHEPPEALFAGADGLDSIRCLLTQTGEHLSVRLLALEVGAGQAPAVAELMRAAGFENVGAKQDLAGIERVVVGERSGQRAGCGSEHRRQSHRSRA